MEMMSLVPEKIIGGGGQIGVDERSKNLNFDCIMKAFFIKRNNTGNHWGQIQNQHQKWNQ